MNRLRGKGPGKLLVKSPHTLEPISPVPSDLENHTTITIADKTFEIQADDLELICQLGMAKKSS